MNKNIEKNIKELTGTNKMVSLEELCNYINNECYKEFGIEYNYTCDILIDEGATDEFVYKIEDNNHSYYINESHIEETRCGYSSLIVKWITVEKLNDKEEILDIYYFL